MDRQGSEFDRSPHGARRSPARRRPPPRLMLGVAAAVFGADQLTKWLALRYLAEPVDVVWTLRLALTYNTGTAFSLGLGLGPFIGLAAVGIVVALARLGRTVVGPLGLWALGLLMGGAVGNLADRAFRSRGGLLDGAVIDFIDLQWWPVFNVADMAIVVGAFVLALRGLGAAPPAAPPSSGREMSPPPVEATEGGGGRWTVLPPGRSAPAPGRRTGEGPPTPTGDGGGAGP